MNTYIPHYKDYPKAYIDWIYSLVNKDEIKEWSQSPNNSLPRYKKQEIVFTKTSIIGFAKNCVKYILI